MLKVEKAISSNFAISAAKQKEQKRKFIFKNTKPIM